ncbi:MAG: EAL domain-containing protein [Burkholderiaceae bacterium]
MASHFNKAKWLNFFGQSGASMLTVALCWPLASSAGLISFLAVHQVLLLIVIAAFASPLGRRWVDGSGMPKMTAPALAVTQTIGGSVMWFDLLASQDITFALAALLVIYASAAFTVATLGPMRDLARLVLFASLLPSTVATLYCGHYLLGIATLVFIGVVGLYGIAQIHSAYMQLLRMQNESAQDARAANEMARRDSLTGLLNRDGVAEQYKLHQTDLRSAFFIDLDRFKKVNDEAGHLAGDELLRQVATRLNRCVPAGSIVARVGGDEFLILMTLDDLDRLNTLGEEIIVRLEESFVLPVGTYAISASIGICLIQAEQTLERVFHEADNAMYRAKRNGRARVKVFTKDMDLELKSRSDLEKELVWLIDRGEFPIYGQPIFDLATGDVRAVEVLIRPRFRDGKRYSPAAVLPVLEELKLLDIMTGIVLQQATRARSEWRSIPALRNAAVSINIPAQSLTSDWLVHEVRNLIAQYSLEPGDLIFEITEYALTSDVEKSRLTLLALRDIGVQISLDDFGIGHSSLSQLLSFPLSLVKIDKSVIQHVDQLSQSRRFMEAIIEVASSLGHDVVAEGIESQAQLDAVYAAGATLGQGFLFSHPKPIDVLIATLGNQKKSSLSVRPARRKPGAVRLPRARGGDRAVSTSG